RLGNLIALYDANQISIEDDTNIAFSEDVAKRYEAYGWHVQTVSWRTESGYHEDIRALYDAFRAAQAVTDQPSLIVLQTIIGWPAPNLQNTGKAHGNALGEEEVAATKKVLGFDPDKHFDVAPEVLDHVRKVRDRGAEARQRWDSDYERWRSANPERAALLDRLRERRLPEGWEAALPTFE